MGPVEIAQPRRKLSVAPNLISQSLYPATRPGDSPQPVRTRAAGRQESLSPYRLLNSAHPNQLLHSLLCLHHHRLGRLRLAICTIFN